MVNMPRKLRCPAVCFPNFLSTSHVLPVCWVEVEVAKPDLHARRKEEVLSECSLAFARTSASVSPKNGGYPHSSTSAEKLPWKFLLLAVTVAYPQSQKLAKDPRDIHDHTTAPNVALLVILAG